ncbi:hypothetical protein [Leptothoe sp. PORK10 BA2]|uniref:hypothetical protein n=1 Tax=Leptothoe sp. PORK10 BA2 TaxID=3110254 RepID=UPI002B204BD6|nr:hypothetical protein [Leptothoe sp. PORK10 BA2]MEA5463035.1 hypothetical protein [Leptothoe sp. PORK10 BA2]
MDRVKSQAAVVSQLLFDPKTAGAYKDVLTLTGTIVKEVALLAWLLICSIFVFGAWFSDTAISSGQNARKWWQSQQLEAADGNQAAAATGQALLDVSKNGAYFLLNKAREQLGLDQLEPPATPDATKAVKSTATKVAEAAKTATTAAVDKVTAVAQEAKAAMDKASDADE